MQPAPDAIGPISNTQLLLYQAIFDASPEAIIVTDLNGQITLVNGRVEDYTGYAPDEITGLSIGQLPFLEPDSQAVVVGKFKQRLKHGQIEPYTLPVIGKTGRKIFVRITGELIRDQDQKPQAVLVMVAEISALNAIQAELQAANRLLTATTEAAENFLHFIPDHWEANVIKILELLGQSSNAHRVYAVKTTDPQKLSTVFLRYEWQKGSHAKVFAPEPHLQTNLDTEPYLTWFNRLKSGQSVTLSSPDSYPHLWNLSLEAQSLVLVPVFVANDWWGYLGFELLRPVLPDPSAEINALKTIALIFGAAIKRKRSDEQLLTLKLGIERSQSVIIITDKNSNITYVNPAFVSLYGYTREEVIGQNPRLFKSGLMDPSFYRWFWGQLTAKSQVVAEVINKTKAGSLINLEVSVNPILNKQQDIIGYMAIQTDITQRKRAEKELIARTNELERLNQVMVGRELKMIELKKQLKNLKTQLNPNSDHP